MAAPRRRQDSLVRSLLDDTGGKRISGPLRWQRSSNRIEARWPVRNSHGARLELVMSLSPGLPWRVHLILFEVLLRLHVARLDVRDDHSNRKTDGRVWRSQTHLHVWSEKWGESNAIDFPHQVWADDARVVKEGEYRQILEAFCSWCHIEIDEGMTWEDPPVDNDAADQQLEGDVP